MTTVGVRELKNNLSQYLRDVKKGRPVVVTERGHSIAILIPAKNHPDAQIARQLMSGGIGSWKGGKPKGASRPVAVKGKSVSRIVIEERR
jgi:prevent-host-death family protein